jgi:hypothetical protein
MKGMLQFLASETAIWGDRLPLPAEIGRHVEIEAPLGLTVPVPATVPRAGIIRLIF